jgi:catechol 2,3-dioxygenase-like lactoylglutathione lyase family enzyme
MIDHIGIHVKDIERSKDFYAKALAPLGYEILMEFGPHVGMGVGQKPDFWLSEGEPNRVHVCFRAKDRAAVRAFHAAAMAAGGRDNGAPGLRVDYHPNYYGGFVFDPDGNNVEAVKHEPE